MYINQERKTFLIRLNVWICVNEVKIFIEINQCYLLWKYYCESFTGFLCLKFKIRCYSLWHNSANEDV